MFHWFLQTLPPLIGRRSLTDKQSEQILQGRNFSLCISSLYWVFLNQFTNLLLCECVWVKLWITLNCLWVSLRVQLVWFQQQLLLLSASSIIYIICKNPAVKCVKTNQIRIHCLGVYSSRRSALQISCRNWHCVFKSDHLFVTWMLLHTTVVTLVTI